MPKTPLVIAGVMLLVATAPMPYGYYMLLRLVVCGVCCFAAWSLFSENHQILPWLFALLAILFNPIVKVHFPKETWAVLDLVIGAFFLVLAGMIAVNENRENRSNTPANRSPQS